MPAGSESTATQTTADDESVLRRTPASVGSSSDGDIGSESATEPTPGQIIAGRYRLIEHLGAGGHGEVWGADDLVLRERVALKWIRHAVGSFHARIRREITTLRLLCVPGVVRLLDDGIED